MGRHAMHGSPTWPSRHKGAARLTDERGVMALSVRGWRSLVGDQAARLRDAERTSVVALPAQATGPPAGTQRAGRGLCPADAAALPAKHVGDADGDGPRRARPGRPTMRPSRPGPGRARAI